MKILAKTAAMSRAEWLAARKQGLGGSDMAAILGLNPWRTPFDVWHDKTGRAPELPDNDAMRWGRILEDVVAKEYQARSGNPVRNANVILQHDNHPYLLANLDRLVMQNNKAPLIYTTIPRIQTDTLLECKTAGQYTSGEWGEPGSDQIPEYYIPQVQLYMEITGCEKADVAVLIGGRDFRIYTVGRDDELVSYLIKAARRFWALVEADIPPEPKTLSDLAKAWPRDNGATVEAGPGIEDDIMKLREIKAEIKSLESGAQALEAAIKKNMGDAAMLANNGGKRLATWKTQVRKIFNQKQFKTDHPGLAKEYIEETEGRVFRLCPAKHKKGAAA